MENQVHILNGDALKERFPQSLSNGVIVIRECFIEGNLQGSNLEELFQNRMKFLANSYPDVSKTMYEDHVIPEFRKIQSLPENTEINLWFEDDLFCQVNFWFVTYLIAQSNKVGQIFLVRPLEKSRYSFGHLTDDELLLCYKKRISISKINSFAALWKHYKKGDTDSLINCALKLKEEYPFLLPAVLAHVDRIPKEGFKGKPALTLLNIIEELDTKDFGIIFREFCKREAIYGFGDSQVKRIFDKLISEIN